MTTLRLYNSATRRKETFAPLDPANVRLYVCGPTVYDRAHLGNARPVVVFDVLFRLLRHLYGAGHVTYVRNFTDVDDKINARAAEMKAAGDARPLEEIIRDITGRTIRWYHEDMDALGALRPTAEPRATEWIGAMIDMIAALIARGHAYEAQGHVLFRVRSYAAYGALSGRSVDDMIAGARVEVAPFKEDPMDFVLWKPSDAGLPGWDSPWGRGRPGWHIECSAMARALLGASFDIHGGGLDLLFPHHENEIAQSVCAHPGEGFARLWLHNEMLLVDGRKMAKSLGNFVTVRDLLDRGIPGEVIRYVLLMTHYRKPLDWTAEKVEEARRAVARLHAAVGASLDGLAPEPRGAAPAVVAALADDLNTPAALAALSALAAAAADGAEADRRAAARGLADTLAFLGLWNPQLGQPAEAAADDPRLRELAGRLLQLRTEAAARKDFTAVDALKSALWDAGVEVRMSRTTVELVPRPDFDRAKLDAIP
jgi:cysteinyl-tRNA synthetase